MSRATNVLWSVREHLASINEDSIVKFNGQVNPESGFCVIMAGGSGSGKGYILDTKVAIEGKIFDVDRLKKLYAKKNDLDMNDGEVTASIHTHGQNNKWKQKQRSFYFADKEGSNPNVIFDITGDDLGKIKEIVNMVNKIGDYSTSLIWVVTSRERAIIQNLLRPRTVPDSKLHDIHTDVNKSMLGLLLDKSIQNQYDGLIDEMWVVINSEESAKKPLNRTNPKGNDYIPFSNKESADEYRRRNTENIFQVKKTGKPFDVPADNLKKIKNIIGSQDREDYYTSEFIKKNNLISGAERGRFRVQKNANVPMKIS